MSIKSKVIVFALLLVRVAWAEPVQNAEQVSLPWQLHPMTTSNAVAAETAVAAFRDPQGNIDIAETTALSASYQLTDRWAPMIRLGFVGNNAPGAALDGTSVGNPIVGATYARTTNTRRFALFAAVAIPVGSGGGSEPDPRAERTNAASITARPADEAMFEVDYATAIAGADLAYVNHGFTAQAETTLVQSVRVRGDKTAAGADALRTRATLGGHVGGFLGSYVSLGADLEYRRWLSHPTMLDEMSDPGSPSVDQDPATLTVSLGARVHFQLGNASIHPGLSYTRGFDGLALHGPMNLTRQTNTVGISIPVLF
ncbi:MAG: hypothetical protein ABJE66_20750 [Deltaproteobacteria bacterium]